MKGSATPPTAKKAPSPAEENRGNYSSPAETMEGHGSVGIQFPYRPRKRPSTTTPTVERWGKEFFPYCNPLSLERVRVRFWGRFSYL